MKKTEHAALQAPDEPSDALIDPNTQILEASITKMLIPGSQYAVSGPKVGNAPFLVTTVLIGRNESRTARISGTDSAGCNCATAQDVLRRMPLSF